MISPKSSTYHQTLKTILYFLFVPFVPFVNMDKLRELIPVARGNRIERSRKLGLILSVNDQKDQNYHVLTLKIINNCLVSRIFMTKMLPHKI